MILYGAEISANQPSRLPTAKFTPDVDGPIGVTPERQRQRGMNFTRKSST